MGGILSDVGDIIWVELYAYVEYTNPPRPKFGFVYLSLCVRGLTRFNSTFLELKRAIY